MKLFDTTLARLKTAMDARLVRQNVLAGNLANVDTPGYVPRDLDFDKAMALAGPRTFGEAPAPVSATQGHIALDGGGGDGAGGVERYVEAKPGTGGGLDGNGVDLDSSMVELAKNGLLYGAAAKASAKKLAILRYVASDGVG